MNPVIVLGAGVKAVHFCDLFNLWNNIIQLYEEPYTRSETKRGKPVKDTIIVIDQPLTVYSAVGDTRDKRTLIKRFTEDATRHNVQYTWGTLTHQTTVITNPQHIGVDFIIRELSSVGSQCSIGNHVSIGPLANVSHNTVIGDYSTICGQAAISGGVTLGEGVFIGQGASVKPKVKIGDGAIVGTGAVVTRDVPPNMVVAGNPARSNIKFRKLPHW